MRVALRSGSGLLSGGSAKPSSGGRMRSARRACNPAITRCNQGKGARLDPRRWEDETLQRVIAGLQARRAERMRPPLEG
ncbi:MAG TPA: hypothetical protein VM869_03260, partial [Enhygromyxa sp.]|nr:hypothetical protein [Enhygromyxa sp.]